MQQIKNIIFDLGGVIMNIDNRLTEDAFVKLGAIDFRNYFGHGFAASFFMDYESGKISDHQFVNDLRKMIQVDQPDEVIIAAWNALLLDFPSERIELLKALKTQYRLFLLSNTNALHMISFQKIYTDHFGEGKLDDHFERTYYSHLTGHRKPDRESYQLIIDENQLTPEETLFVDDAKINIEGALALGLQGLFLQPGMAITSIKWNSI
jgi:HAD superfamily hydrolase (TIGR01509 family)